MKDSISQVLEGKIKAERIKNGKVIETIKQDNLVVDGGYDLLVKLLSGEPRDILWKSPVPTKGWNSTSDAPPPIEGVHYEMEYTYRPQCIVYSGSSSRNANYSFKDFPEYVLSMPYIRIHRIEVMPEPFSTDAVNFVALGLENKNFFSPLEEEVFTYDGDFLRDSNSSYFNGHAYISSSVQDKVVVELNCNELEFALAGRVSNYVSDVQVYVNGEQQFKISGLGEDGLAEEGFNSISTQSDSNETLWFKISDFDMNKDDQFNKIEFVHNGVEGQELIFEGARSIATHPSFTSLLHEVPNETREIEIADRYSVNNDTKTFFIDTKESALELIEDSVEVYSGEQDFKNVTSTGLEPDPEPGSYEFSIIDKSTGEVRLSESVDNVGVTYKLTGAFDTNYRRSPLRKPQEGYSYPIFNYRQNKVTFETRFEEDNPRYPVNIKQLGLYNKPTRKEVDVMDSTGEGYYWHDRKNPDLIPNDTIVYPEYLFSVANIEGIIKRPDELLRVVWEIQLHRR